MASPSMTGPDLYLLYPPFSQWMADLHKGMNFGFRHSSGENSDTSFEMDESRDYPLLRREQNLGFR